MLSPTALVARLAPHGVLAAAAAYLAAVFVLMAFRVPYPFEIEWMEGSMVDHVRRVVDGQPLYVAPSLEFVPFIYPPGFYVASAVVSSVVGEGFLGLRLTSALSSAGLIVFIGAMVFKETGRRDAAFIGAGLFAATFRIGGAWFDVGRADMLLLLLLFAAFFMARYSGSRWTFLVTGVLLGAAFLTKQSAAVMAAPVVLWMLAARRAQGVGTALVTVVVAGGGTLLLDAWHDGWYRYYVFGLPSSYPLYRGRMLTFFSEDLMPVAGAAGLGLVALLAGSDWRTRGFRTALAAGLFAGSFISRANDGGYANVLLPAYAATSVMAGIGFDTLRRALARGDAVSPQMAAAWPSLLLLAQFAVLVYNPLEQMPSASDEAAGRRLVTSIRESPGDVWIPYHGYLSTAAGKAPRANWMGIADILRYGPDEVRAPLARELSTALAERRFDLIVMSNRPFPNFPSLDASYERSAQVFDTWDVFLPLTGAQRRPEWFYVPRRTDVAPVPDTAPAPAAKNAPTTPGS